MNLDAEGRYQLPTSQRFVGDLKTADVWILAAQFGGTETPGPGPKGWNVAGGEGSIETVVNWVKRNNGDMVTPIEKGKLAIINWNGYHAGNQHRKSFKRRKPLPSTAKILQKMTKRVQGDNPPVVVTYPARKAGWGEIWAEQDFMKALVARNKELVVWRSRPQPTLGHVEPSESAAVNSRLRAVGVKMVGDAKRKRCTSAS
ncbi:hypothetical protein WJX74_003863 [Apatococcus lobatus]|uniref:Uncharacterized protein n=1 Tax=Apatococcus lobatus TaxID=904363 RepID=A0AAW1RVG6_9CHLO